MRLRLLELQDISGVCAFFVKMCGEMFAGGEGFGSVVSGMRVVRSKGI